MSAVVSFLIVCCFCLSGMNTLSAGVQSTQGQSTQDKQTPSQQLLDKQRVLIQRVEQLEATLLKNIEFESDQNPERAKILQKSLALSQSAELTDNLRKIETLFKNGGTVDLEKSVELQKKILVDLNRLYDLMESNDLLKAKRSETEKIRKRIDRLSQVIQRQQGIRQRADTGSNESLKSDQNRVERQTLELEKEIRDDKQVQPSDSSTDSPNSRQDQPIIKPETPDATEDKEVEENLKAARERMRKAASQLNPENRQVAIEEMESAEQQLAKAKQKLEEILRQNREEEIQSTLRTLEERFKKMLQMQIKLNEASADALASKPSTAELRIESSAIAAEQKKIMLEVDKALLVLNEEGTSRSIPATLYLLRMDMQEIVGNLESSPLDQETRRIQNEVAELLAELIKAVQQEQAEQSQLKRMAQQPDVTSSPVERPLVQKLSELKIIRQLQSRINKRHRNYASSVNSSSDAQLKQKLGIKTQQLAEKQQQLKNMTLELIKTKEQLP